MERTARWHLTDRRRNILYACLLLAYIAFNLSFLVCHENWRDEAQAWLDRQMERYARDGFGLWAVVLKETGAMIGQCGLTYQDADGVRVVEVGYLFRRSFWHRGYATEAARVCRDYAFDQVGVDTVYSIIRDTNIPSQKVALRNGMKPEGSFVKRYRDVDMPHIVYAVSRAVRDGVY